MSESPSVAQAMAAVMADVGAVAKSDRNQAQGFSFRGIDSVVNAVGPVLRKHGVVMVPTAHEPTIDHYQSKNGAAMTHVLLPVTFTFYGPAGDSIRCQVIGEAADSGDKCLSKAHSVAWRIALLECFAIPTDEPDPDAATAERAPASEPAPPPVDWSALGWKDQADYDRAWGVAVAEGKLLPEPQATAAKIWFRDQGWDRPLTADQLDAWVAKITDLALDAAPSTAGADGDEPVEPPAEAPGSSPENETELPLERSSA